MDIDGLALFDGQLQERKNDVVGQREPLQDGVKFQPKGSQAEGPFQLLDGLASVPGVRRGKGEQAVRMFGGRREDQVVSFPVPDRDKPVGGRDDGPGYGLGIHLAQQFPGRSGVGHAFPDVAMGIEDFQ